METKIYKGKDGFTAQTTTELHGTGLHIRVSTHKSNGHLITTATCFKRNDGFETCRIFQDFYKVMAKEKVRVTEKAVTNQHATITAIMPDILDMAKVYYTSEEYIQRYGKQEA